MRKKSKQKKWTLKELQALKDDLFDFRVYRACHYIGYKKKGLDEFNSHIKAIVKEIDQTL